MSEEPGFTPDSPLTRNPRKRSWLVVWVFIAAIGALALVVGRELDPRTGPGGFIVGAIYVVVIGGIRLLRWWAESGEGPSTTLNRWLK